MFVGYKSYQLANKLKNVNPFFFGMNIISLAAKVAGYLDKRFQGVSTLKSIKSHNFLGHSTRGHHLTHPPHQSPTFG